MKKKEIKTGKTEKKLSLDKFKIAELKNPRVIFGGKEPPIKTSPFGV